MPRRSGGRSAFALNAAMSFTLLGLVAATAVIVRSPSPPGIAEFAPQAARPITKAPLSQTGSTGATPGASASPTPSASPRSAAQAAAAVLKGVPSALQCYSWPDGSVTQTSDPQSPPCVASWPSAANGNGGATSRGVSASTIRVAFPSTKGSPEPAQMQHIVDWFNGHYQLYGRKLQLVPFESQQLQEAIQGTNFSDPQAQRADAVQAASLNTFAATDFLDRDSNVLVLPTYLDTLAQRGVVSVVGGENVTMASEAGLAAHLPYQWSYSPTLAQLFEQTATMTCAQLVGHPASHSPQFAGKRRTFAVLLPDQRTTGQALDGVSGLTRVLSGCGVKDVQVIYYAGGKSRSGANSMSATFASLRQKGVTSLLYMPWLDQGDPTTSQQGVARSANYRPEWVTIGWMPFATAALMYTKANQPSATFGVAAWSRYLPLPATPWYAAFSAAGGKGDTGLVAANGLYRSLLMLASGIQMAGPRLTPETFATALRSTTFPNPGAGTGPAFQAGVGFAQSGSTMTNDFLGFWIDKDATLTDFNDAVRYNSYDAIFCSVRQGARYSGSTWPRDEAYYEGRCR